MFIHECQLSGVDRPALIVETVENTKIHIENSVRRKCVDVVPTDGRVEDAQIPQFPTAPGVRTNAYSMRKPWRELSRTPPHVPAGGVSRTATGLQGGTTTPPLPGYSP